MSKTPNNYRGIAEQVGEDFQSLLGTPGSHHTKRGRIAPDEGVDEVLAYSREYSKAHLIQLGEALDAEECRELQGALAASNAVAVIDVGCGAGALAHFASNCGFNTYVGVDPNPWMRCIATAAWESTGYGAGLSASWEPEIDIKKEWFANLERQLDVSGKSITSVEQPSPIRPLTVLIAMNHVLHQEVKVHLTVNQVVTIGDYLSALEVADVWLLSIEPAIAQGEDHFGASGLERLLKGRSIDSVSYQVSSLKHVLRGTGGFSRVRLVHYRC